MPTIAFQGFLRTAKRPGLRGTVTLGAGRISSSDQPRRVLMVGTKLSSGTLSPDLQYDGPFTSEEQVDAGAGTGGELASMGYIGLQLDGVEMWMAAVAENASAVAATAVITFTGTTTTQGSLKGRICGVPWELFLDVGTTAAQAATALVALLNQMIRSPVTQAVTTTTSVTMTSKSKGARSNMLSAYIDQGSMPAGLTASIAGGTALPSIQAQTGCRFTGGSLVDDVSNLAAILKTFAFDTVAVAHVDASNLGKWKALFQQLAAVGSEKFEMYVAGQNGTYSTIQALTTGLNDSFGSIAHIEDSENSPAEIAASLGVLRQFKDNEHPNQSFYNLQLPGLAPLVSPASIPNNTEIEVELSNGITPCVSTTEGIFLVESITTHCLTAVGSGISDFRVFRTGETRTTMRMFQEAALIWETEVQPVCKWVRPDLPDSRQPDQGVITPRGWGSKLNKLCQDKESDHWLIDVGIGNNVNVVVYDEVFKGLVAQVNLTIHPVNSKTALNVRQFAN